MKLTTKLILGATLVAGLSMSAFAACANNVLMGDKQLKDVAEGTDPKDAVNHAQVFKNVISSTIIAEADFNISGHVVRVGKTLNFNFAVVNDTGNQLTGSVYRKIGTLPSGFIPSRTCNIQGYINSEYAYANIIVEPDGDLLVLDRFGTYTANWNNGVSITFYNQVCVM